MSVVSRWLLAGDRPWPSSRYVVLVVLVVLVVSEEVMLLVLQVLVLVATVLLRVEAGLLGAGHGHGSCRAAPFRSDDLDHVGGCPRYAQCCTEYGYCHPRVRSEIINYQY